MKGSGANVSLPLQSILSSCCVSQYFGKVFVINFR